MRLPVIPTPDELRADADRVNAAAVADIVANVVGKLRRDPEQRVVEFGDPRILERAAVFLRRSGWVCAVFPGGQRDTPSLAVSAPPVGE